MTRPGELPPSAPPKARPENPPAFERLTLTEQEVYQSLFHAYREQAVNPSEFSHYDQSKVKEDLDFVERMEAKFANRANPELAFSQRQGELAEAIIWNGVEKNGWLGPDASVIVPSRYDDIAHGVDEVVEFDREEGFDYLALSIDVTSSPNQTFEKLRKIRGKLDKGQLAEIKYFKSEATSFTGHKDNVPHVIAGFDRKTLQELSILEAKIIRLNRAIKAGEDNQYNIDQRSEAKVQLGRHWAQILLLKEIKMQLEVFEGYARRNGKVETADFIKKDLAIINAQIQERTAEISPTRKEQLELEEQLKSDTLYEALQSGLKDFDRI